MTFRARPAGDRQRRSSLDAGSRRSLYINIGFAAVIAASFGILILAAVASWWGDHFAAVATVNGTTITKDDYRERLAVEDFRLDQQESRVRDDLNAGRLTDVQANQQLSFIEQQRQQVSSLALERLIDAQIQGELAVEEGVEVTAADVDAQLTTEATLPEQRQVWMIEVRPEVSDGSTEPTAEQRAAAKAEADKALSDIKGGSSFEEVARQVSDHSSSEQGGDLGWIKASNALDPAFGEAVFAAAVDAPTDVVEGDDGVYRIGRVSEIAPETVDDTYESRITSAGISMDSYRKAITADVTRQKLDDKVTAAVVSTPSVQRRVSEIYVAETQGTGDEVMTSHILYSPNDDPGNAASVADDDPAWAQAEADAKAAYDKLLPLVGTPEMETAFADLAREESDDTGSGASGGQLPFYTQDQVDRAFGDAIFDPKLQPGDLLEPVKSSFGWHVILFGERRAPAQERITGAQLEAAAPGADFAAIARERSEGPTAADGGDLGWVARLQLQKELEDPIFAAPVGGLTDVVDVPGDGFYLFKILAEETRLPEGDQLTNLENTAFSTWYGEKKAAATIERNQDELAGL
jgi:parvulin-like peptidyl-prolyl isomerase